MSNLIRREDALRVTLAYSSSYSAEQAETAIRAIPAMQSDNADHNDPDDPYILQAIIDSLLTDIADLTRQLQGQPRRPQDVTKRGAQPHVNETPKSEHDIANMLTLTAERDRLRYERDAILLDGTIHSDQREKYERLCARIAAGKASQQDAVDAIRQLCRDNERLALRRSDARAALKGESHD